MRGVELNALCWRWREVRHAVNTSASNRPHRCSRLLAMRCAGGVSYLVSVLLGECDFGW